MNKLTTLATLLLLVGCGKPTYYSVDTYGRGIEQPAAGQNLLAAAPIDDDYRVRVTGGVGTVVVSADAPANGPALYTPRQTINGGIAVRASNLEFEFVGSGSLTEATGKDAPGRGASYGGVRMRATPGNDLVRLNVVIEGGIKRYSVQHGTSVICELTPEGPGWNKNAEGCWASEVFSRDSESFLTGYVAATLYPSFQVIEGVHLFAGAGVESVATNYRRSSVYVAYETGPSFAIEEEHHPEWSYIVNVVGGIEAEMADFVSVLFNVRSAPFGEHPLSTVAEAAVSLRF